MVLPRQPVGRVRVDVDKARKNRKAAPVDLDRIGVIGRPGRADRGDGFPFDRQVGIAPIDMGLNRLAEEAGCHGGRGARKSASHRSAPSASASAAAPKATRPAASNATQRGVRPALIPAGRMMMQMVGSFAEFERAMIRERTSAGLAAARAEGRVGGRRKKLDAAKRREIAESVITGRKSGAEMAPCTTSASQQCHGSSPNTGRPTHSSWVIRNWDGVEEQEMRIAKNPRSNCLPLR